MNRTSMLGLRTKLSAGLVAAAVSAAVLAAFSPSASAQSGSAQSGTINTKATVKCDEFKQDDLYCVAYVVPFNGYNYPHGLVTISLIKPPANGIGAVTMATQQCHMTTAGTCEVNLGLNQAADNGDSVLAFFAGSNGFSPTYSGPLPYTLADRTTTTAVTCQPDPVQPLDDICQATVSDATGWAFTNATPPSGAVTWTYGGNPVAGSQRTLVATSGTTSRVSGVLLPAPAPALSAHYAGDAVHAASSALG